jgi:hypothetical protein
MTWWMICGLRSTMVRRAKEPGSEVINSGGKVLFFGTKAPYFGILDADKR